MKKIDGIIKNDYSFNYPMKPKKKEFNKVKLKTEEEIRILRTITRILSTIIWILRKY